MKVKDLIMALGYAIHENPEVENWKVVTEGCDCDDDLGSVEVRDAHLNPRTYQPDPYIYLRRDKS